MKPIDFKESDRSLNKPENMSEEECGSLPVVAVCGATVSCWTASWRERLKFLFTGRIWLSVHFGGKTQPPVSLTVDKFLKRKKT